MDIRPPAPSRSSSILWLGLLLAAIVWFFHPCLFQNHSLVPTDLLHDFYLPRPTNGVSVSVQNHYPSDQVTQMIPSFVFWQQSMKAGEVPIWNGYYYGGHPQLGTSIWHIFAPTKLLTLLGSLERAYTFGYILLFALAGGFMFGFLRELGRSPGAAFVGALAYALSSQFQSFYWVSLTAFAFVPLVLWLFECSLRRNSLVHALATGVALGLTLISSNIQMAFFAGFLCGFYALGSLLPNAETTTPWPRKAAFIALIFTVGLLLASIQFLPTLELISREATERLRDPGAIHAGWRESVVGIAALVSFLFPALPGSPQTFDLMKFAGTTMMHFNGYIGLVPFGLFLIGSYAARDRRVRWLWLLSAVVLFVVFFTPLVRYVYHRFFLLIVFAMAMAAARGADVILESAPHDLRRIRRVVFGLAGAGLLAVLGLIGARWYTLKHHDALVQAGQRYVMERLPNHMHRNYPDWMRARMAAFVDHYRLGNPLFWVPLTTLGAFVGLWFVHARWRLDRRVFQATLAVLPLIDLTVLGRSWVPQVDLNRYPAFPTVDLLAPIQKDPELCRVERWMPGDPLLFAPNLLNAYQISIITGYESMAPENLTSVPNRTADRFNAWLDLQNVKYVLCRETAELPRDRFEPVGSAPGVRLFRNKTCLPRVQFVPRWEVIPNRQQIRERLTAPGGDPRQVVLLERSPVAQPASATNAEPPRVEVLSYSHQRARIQVHCSQPGVVRVSDTWYPGWKARLDGQPAPLYRADYILKAVVVPPGTHEVEIYYASAVFRTGAAITWSTLSLVLLCGVVHGWRSRRR